MTTTYDSTINSFYLAYYGRPADPAGLAFWATQLDAVNGDFGAIAQAFATSNEATVRFGSSDAAARISQIYEQLFDRAPDSEGLAFWTKAIEQGHMTVSDAAIQILQGAQHADADLSALRQQAVESFTAEVLKSGVAYDGFAAIEASRVLVKAVSVKATGADIDAMVKATAKLVDIAHDNPKVIEAIAINSTLTKLFDTARGQSEPVNLVKALADVAQAAAGSPSTLDSLLRGGGMDNVLKVMPADATLGKVVDALASGGLPAAIEVVYPTPSSPAPKPAPVAGTLEFIDLTGGSGNELPVTSNPMLLVELHGNSPDTTVTYQISRNGTDWGSPMDIGAQTDGAYYYRALVTNAAGKSSYSNVIGAVLDRTGPMPTLFTLGSNDRALALGDTLSLKVKFNETVQVDTHALPSLALNNGGTATYVSGNGTDTLVFSYTAGAGEDIASLKTAESHALQGSIVDRVGNAVSAQVFNDKAPDHPVTVDTIAPQQALTVTTIAQQDGNSTAAIANVALETNLASAALHATLSAELKQGDYVEVSLDGGQTWEPVHATVDGLDVTVQDIPTGDNPTVTLRVSDAAGNHGPSISQDIIYDRVAPQLGTLSLVSMDHGPDDAAPDDAVSNVATVDAQFSFTGALGVGERLEYSVNGQDWIPVEPDNTGHGLTIQGIDLAGGMLAIDGNWERTVSLRAIDRAGNASEVVNKTLTYDKYVAGLEFIAVEGSGGGNSAATGLSQANVFFHITGRIEATDRVEYRLGSGSWSDVPASGVDKTTKTITIENLDLASADPTLEVRIVDVAGNVSSVSQKIDGPFVESAGSVMSWARPDGVHVSAPAGELYLISDGFPLPLQVKATALSQADADGATILLGQQDGTRGGSVQLQKGGGVTIDDGTHNVYILGSSAGETITGHYVWGFDGNDTITGLAASSYLSGGSGNDTITGGAGDDTIIGGYGADVLSGGGGADTFVFSKPGDAAIDNTNPSAIETITDFDASMDRLDFSGSDTRDVRADHGITIDTTFHQTLTELIADANDASPNSGLFLGQVGRDVYVLGRDGGTPGQYDAGIDTIVRLKNVSLLDIKASHFVGLSGGEETVGEGTVADALPGTGGSGTTMDMEVELSSPWYIRGSGHQTLGGTVQDDIFLSGVGGESMHLYSGNDQVVCAAPSQSFATDSPSWTYDTVYKTHGSVMFDFGAAVSKSYEVTRGAANGESFLAFLNNAFQSAQPSGGGYQAMLLNDTGLSDARYLVVDTGDGVINEQDYVISIVGSSSNSTGFSVNTNGGVVTVSLFDILD